MDKHKTFGNLFSGPSPLIWDATGYPVVPESDVDSGLIYHLASRIEPYQCRERPEGEQEYHDAVAGIADVVAHRQRQTYGNPLDPSFSFSTHTDKLPEFIKHRRSARKYNGTPVSVDNLSTMVAAAFGMRPSQSIQVRTVVASPGGLYPIDSYLLLWNVDGLSEGIYFVDRQFSTVALKSKRSVLPELAECQFSISSAECREAAGAIVMVYVAERLQWKYGQRSYRFACMEAGHLMHALAIGSSLAGTSLCPLGGFCDSAVDSLLGIDGNTEMAVYMAIFGNASITA
jgi:hypothetical protein